MATVDPQQQNNALIGTLLRHPATTTEEHDSVQEMMHDEASLTEALGVVAASMETTQENGSTSSMESEGRSVNDNTLRRMLSGKTIEAMSWLIGSEAVTYKTYVRVNTAMNECLRKLPVSKGLYPSYGTLIYTIFDIMKESVLIRRRDIQASVNTRRSGVAQRHVREQISGRMPTATFSVVLPRDWARLDYLHYQHFREPFFSRTRMPAVLNIEAAPIVPVQARLMSELSFYELLPDTNGFRTGQELREGDGISICLTGPPEAVAVLVEFDGNVSSSELDGCRTGIFRGRIGRTEIATEDDRNKGIRKCDAITTLLKEDGMQWADASLVHRFAPKAGERTTFVVLTDISGHLLDMKWSELRRITAPLAPGVVPTGPTVNALEDGRPFTVLRCLLYSDDFQPFQFKNASCGGVYLMPLSIPPFARAGVHALRILGLTPPGVRSDEAIRAIIQDLVQASSVCMTFEMEDGSKNTIFIDVVGYIGDYPENAHLLDVTGVTGSSPCTLCTFSRAGVVHSGSLSFRRTRQRMQMCREQNLSSSEMKRLGLRELDGTRALQLVLHELSEQLEQARSQVPLAADGQPAAPCMFDPYMSSYVAPDHVLVGLGEDVTKAPASPTANTARAFQLLSDRGTFISGLCCIRLICFSLDAAVEQHVVFILCHSSSRFAMGHAYGNQPSNTIAGLG